MSETKLPPQNSQEANSPTPEKSGVFGVIVHSFFVIPFLLAVLSVLFLTAVRILTMEKRTAYDYLKDVKVGGLPKRWQSAFELSRILANPEVLPREERFSRELIDAFTAAKEDDERVKQYLSLAMARTGRPEFVPILIQALADKKDENVHAFIYALGILKDVRAVSVLLKYLDDADSRIRLAAVMALGNIGAPETREKLRGMLNDAEPNVRWDAAIALAKMKDTAAKEPLLTMLDRAYLAQFPEVDSQEQAKILIVTIQAAAPFKDPDLIKEFEKLSQNDKNMNVRQAAFDAIKLSTKS